MSSALIEFSVKFNVLKSCVVDVRAEKVDGEVEDVPYHKHGNGKEPTEPLSAAEHNDNNVVREHIDHVSDNAGRKAETEQTGVTEQVADDVDGAVCVAQNAADRLDGILFADQTGQKHHGRAGKRDVHSYLHAGIDRGRKFALDDTEESK